MKILLTNDDGIFAPGLMALYKELVKLGDVTVVAPSDVQSATSHSISLLPVIVNKIDINGEFHGYSVQGSPADCVKLAVLEIMKDGIDLIVSGMNDGSNVGVHVCYSGTVAAAMEGAFYDIPSVAMSAAIEKEMNFEKSVEYGVEVLQKLLPLKASDVININIPQLKNGKPKGIKAVPQSINGFDEKYIKTKNSAGQIEYQLTGGLHHHEKIDTDTICLVDGYITVTALHYDMTEYKRSRELAEKLSAQENNGESNG